MLSLSKYTIYLIPFVSGILMGLLIAAFIRELKKKFGRDEIPEVQEKIVEVIKKDPKKEYDQNRFLELIQLLRDKETNKLVMDINGKIIEDSSVFGEKVQKRLILLANEWLEQLGVSKDFQPGEAGNAATEKDLNGTQKSIVVEPEVDIKQTSFISDEIPFPVPIKEETSTKSIYVETKPAPDFVENGGSIVQQINAILLAMLPHTPLRNKAIRLSESPTEGVIILVGLERYVGVEAVTDPAVKALVKAAVAEWEKRQ
ncbi:MAG: hypothetical protein JEZ06_02785 [Anaerolineaceae bacterium]|nr:hypothetical protein [Anaerolineaceae bacterium]